MFTTTTKNADCHEKIGEDSSAIYPMAEKEWVKCEEEKKPFRYLY